MGTIKDIVDLSTQLATSVQDRKVTAELNQIQSLTLQLQSEQAQLHETNIKLREEKLKLAEKVQSLEKEIKNLKEGCTKDPEGVPICPNCSTNTKPYYMKPVAVDFISILGATHECAQCGFNTNISR